MKSEINLVLTLLHTVSRSCKGLAKQNCSRSQNAAVEVFLALWSVLIIMQLMTGVKDCSFEKKALLYMDLDELLPVTKQRNPDDGTEKAWEQCVYPWDCNCITTSTVWVKKFAYGPKHCSPQINERKFTGNTGGQQFPHSTTVQIPSPIWQLVALYKPL